MSHDTLRLTAEKKEEILANEGYRHFDGRAINEIIATPIMDSFNLIKILSAS